MKNGIRKFWNKHSSTIMTGAGIIFSVASTVLAVKVTPKAVKLYNEAKENNESNAKCIAKATTVYLPVIGTEVASIICNVSSHRRSRTQYFSTLAALAGAKEYIATLEGNIKKHEGEERLMDIRRTTIHDHPDYNGSSDPNAKLFYLRYGPYKEGQYFESTLEDVAYAMYHFNRNFILKGSASLNDLLRMFTLEEVPYGEDYGWDQYIGEAEYGYKWVDFVEDEVVLDGDLECVCIYLPFEAHDDYMGD